MKKYLNKLVVTAGLGILMLTSCKKQETQIYYEGGTAPTLSANVKDTIQLVPADSLSNAIVFTWTNPNYLFSNGLSSQNVTYNIQIDTMGANFTNPLLQTISNTSVSGMSITVRDLNTYLAGKKKLALSYGDVHHIQIRLVTQLGVNQAQLFSNVLNYVVTPYAPPAAVTPPTTGTLYIVGTAVAGGWSNPIPAPNVAAQQFTQISNTEYKITTTLGSAQEYKFIAKNGSWGENWGIPTADDPTEITGGGFTSNSGNILAPTSTDPTTLYDIDVNFQIGKFTVTKH